MWLLDEPIHLQFSAELVPYWILRSFLPTALTFNSSRFQCPSGVCISEQTSGVVWMSVDQNQNHAEAVLVFLSDQCFQILTAVFCFSYHSVVRGLQGEFPAVHACFWARVPESLPSLYPWEGLASEEVSTAEHTHFLWKWMKPCQVCFSKRGQAKTKA